MTQQLHSWVPAREKWRLMFTHKAVYERPQQHNSQQPKCGNNQVSMDRWRDKLNVAYSYNGVLHVCAKWLQSCSTLVTLWTVAHQAPLSMGFSRQEHWSGCHALLQEIFPIQGLNPHYLGLLHWQASSLPLAPLGKLQWSSYSALKRGEILTHILRCGWTLKTLH